jgi:glycosyltransferase involved in cell wall biosynthesis
MRILIDIASIDAGGAERQAVYLAAGLAARGDSPLLIVNKRVHAYRREIVHLGVDVVELGHESRLDPRVLLDLVQCIRAFRPHVVLCVMFNATFWGRLASILTGTPAVVAQHSTRKRHTGAVRLSNRLLAPFTPAVVACANGQRRSLVASGHPAGRIAVVHNGIDVDWFVRKEESRRAVRSDLGMDETSFAVGLIAGHRTEKRHDRFIAVIERLRSAGIEAWGLMVGDGVMLETNLRIAQQSPASGRLRILGRRTDLPAVYSACDAVVLVSDDIETFPLCLLEAQACGVPVVAMDTGGVGETLVDRETGFLVPQGDVEGMTNALSMLASDPQVRMRMGSEARRWVEGEFTIARMAEQYAEVLDCASGPGD